MILISTGWEYNGPFADNLVVNIANWHDISQHRISSDAVNLLGRLLKQTAKKVASGSISSPKKCIRGIVILLSWDSRMKNYKIHEIVLQAN